jgi:hypothetical protein
VSPDVAAREVPTVAPQDSRTAGGNDEHSKIHQITQDESSNTRAHRVECTIQCNRITDGHHGCASRRCCRTGVGERCGSSVLDHMLREYDG